MSSKISALTNGAPLLGTDEFALARSGVNRKIAGSAIADYVIGANVLTQTVAQVVANNGNYAPGSSVIVTDVSDSLMLGIVCSAIFTVDELGMVGQLGVGYIENAFMSNPVQCIIELDWIENEIRKIAIPKTGIALTSSHTNNTNIAVWPFDSTTIKDGVAQDPIVTALDTAANLYNFTFGARVNIEMAAGTTFTGDARNFATFSLSGSANILGGILGASSQVTMYGTQQLTSCDIGTGKTLDLSSIDSAYSATGKVYIGNISTFECDVPYDVWNIGSTLEVHNWDGLGGDYSFCGIFTNLTTSASTTFNAIDSGGVIDHEYLFVFVPTGGFTLDFDNSADFITNGSASYRMESNGDIASFAWLPSISKWRVTGNTIIQTPVVSSASFNAAAIAANSATFKNGLFTGVV